MQIRDSIWRSIEYKKPSYIIPETELPQAFAAVTTPMLQFFIAAHELGHAVQHPDTNTSFLKIHTLFSTEKIEVEANTFAVELLLPDDLFLENNESSFTIYDAIKEKGVPIELLSLKSIDGKNFT